MERRRLTAGRTYGDNYSEDPESADLLKQTQETAEDLYRMAFSSGPEVKVPEKVPEEFDCERDLSPTEFLRQKCFPLSYFELSKVFESYIKILDVLHNFQQTLHKLQSQGREPEGTEEYLKVKRRATEFSARFSRNSIYPLRSQIRALDNQLKTVKTYQRGSREALRKSLITVYQSTLQALQTYTSYMASPKNIQVPEKLAELVTLIRQLDETSRNLFVPIMDVQFGAGKGDIMAACCDQLLEMLKAQKVEPEPRKKSKKKKKPDLNEKKSQLSMYEGKLFTWKKKSETLARLRQQKTARKKKEMEEAKVATEGDVAVNLGRKVEGRKDVVVSPDKDIETQVERYGLHDAKTQEDLRKPSAISQTELQGIAKDSPLRKILESALKELETGSEEAALDRIKNINLANSPNLQASKSNVQVLYVRSKTYDDEEDPLEKPMTETGVDTSRTKYSARSYEACDCENCLRKRESEGIYSERSLTDREPISEGLAEDEEFEDDFESYTETDEEAVTVKPQQRLTPHEVRENQQYGKTERQGTPKKEDRYSGNVTEEIRNKKKDELDIPKEFNLSTKRGEEEATRGLKERTRTLENNLAKVGTKKVGDYSPRIVESKKATSNSQRVGASSKTLDKNLILDSPSTRNYSSRSKGSNTKVSNLATSKRREVPNGSEGKKSVFEKSKILEARAKKHSSMDDGTKKTSKSGKSYGSDLQKKRLRKMFEWIAGGSSGRPAKNSTALIPLLVPQDTEKLFLTCKLKIDQRLRHVKHVKPWEMVSRISDELANEVLDEVISELNDDDLVKRLFENELLIL